MPAYASPLPYYPYDCGQLGAEALRLQGRIVELGGTLDQASSNDKVIMGTSLVLFWPAVFALGGTKQQEAEYSRLKGEYEAVQQAAIANKCTWRQPSASAAANRQKTPASRAPRSEVRRANCATPSPHRACYAKTNAVPGTSTN